MTQPNTSARRPTKKDKPENRKTLDIQHNQMIDKLNVAKKERETIEARLSKVDETIAKLHEQFSKTQDDKIMDKILLLKDERYELGQKLAAQEHDNHMNYFLETSDILYKYYDMVEKGGVTESVAPVKPAQNSIMSWFTAAPAPASTNATTNENTEEKSKSIPAESKTSLIEKYLQRTSDNYINSCDQADETCASCGSHNVMLVPSEGQIVCGDCHCVEHVVLDHEKPSYKDPPKEISYWAYKRINHFIMEWKSGLVSLVMKFARLVL